MARKKASIRGTTGGAHPNNLRALRALGKGIRQEDIGEVLGISKSQVSRYEKGNAKLTGEQLQKLAQFFGVAIADILGGSGPAIPPRMALNRAYPVKRIEGEVLVDTAETARFEADAGVKAFVIAMPDNSMEPRIIRGDPILVDPAAKLEPGCVVLARAPRTGEVMVRFYRPLHTSDPRAPGFTLVAANPSFPETVSTKSSRGDIEGRVVKRQETL